VRGQHCARTRGISRSKSHSYQGLANIPRVAMIGAVFSGLYLLTGSLWLPIILHAAVDLLQGRLAYDVMRRVAYDNNS